MKVLSLFSGIGLHDLGLTLAGMKIAGQCEIDPFALAVLAKYWPDVYRWKDVRDVTRESILEHCGHIDLITGGFPCQNLSIAGKGAGIGTEENPTEKSGLVWELLRIIRAVRPHWLILENVPRLRTLGADTILGEMEEIGYSCWPLVVGAEHVGAPHRRHRVWIVAMLANSSGLGERESADETNSFSIGRGTWDESIDCGELANSNHQRREGFDTLLQQGRQDKDCSETSGRGSSVALAGGEGLAGRWKLPVGTEPKKSVFASGCNHLWPLGKGPEQWDWEPPRVVEFGVGGQFTRRLRRLVQDADDTTLEAISGDAQHRRTIEKWANEQALRCYSNANPPHAIELIGKAILNIAESGNAV